MFCNTHSAQVIGLDLPQLSVSNVNHGFSISNCNHRYNFILGKYFLQKISMDVMYSRRSFILGGDEVKIVTRTYWTPETIEIFLTIKRVLDRFKPNNTLSLPY